MKCPNCGNEMVQSRAGWMCLSCGHLENAGGTPATSEPTVSGQGGDTKPADDKPADPEQPVATPAPPWAQASSGSTDQPDPASDTDDAAADKPATDSTENHDDASVTDVVDSSKAADLAAVEQAVAQAQSNSEPEAESNDESAASDAQPTTEPNAQSSDENADIHDKPADLEVKDGGQADKNPSPEPDVDKPANEDTDQSKNDDAADVKPDAEAKPDPGISDVKPDDAKTPNDTSDTEPPVHSDDSDKHVAAAAGPASRAATEDPAPPLEKSADTDHSDAMPGLDVPSKPANEDTTGSTQSPAPEAPAPEQTTSTPPPTETPAAPVNDAQSPSPANDAPAAKTSADQPTATPAADPPATPAATAAPTNGKPPLQPETHPKKHKFHLFGMSLVAAVAFGTSCLAMYSAFTAPSHSASNNSAHAVLGAATVAPNPSDTPAPTPSATPTASTAPAVATDDQTKADLAAYATAYQGAAASGYFPTNPPAVSPQTSRPYTVITAAPTVPGQVYYQAGGVCGAPAHTPGRTGTRYLSLTTLLSTGNPYCLDATR